MVYIVCTIYTITPSVLCISMYRKTKNIRPVWMIQTGRILELMIRFELTTYALPRRCATDCATSANVADELKSANFAPPNKLYTTYLMEPVVRLPVSHNVIYYTLFRYKSQ